MRDIRAEDLDELVIHANDEHVARALTDQFPHPYGRRDGAAWIEQCQASVQQSDWVIAEHDGLIGMIGCVVATDVRRLSADVGYWVGRRTWGQGYATAALTALSEHLFANASLVRLPALVFAWNAASARVLEKASYTCEGRLRRAVVKNGQIMDAGLYARVREDEGGTP